MGDLSPHFSRAEFACPCCGKDSVRQELVDRLEALRARMNRPLVVTSGVRCAKHNAEVGGTDRSAHLRGLAADIAVAGGRDRWLAVQSALFEFSRVGVAKGFVHVDVDLSLPHPVLWTY
jgi:uncharacterized protein YcbK (DUF882 family)